MGSATLFTDETGKPDVLGVERPDTPSPGEQRPDRPISPPVAAVDTVRKERHPIVPGRSPAKRLEAETAKIADPEQLRPDETPRTGCVGAEIFDPAIILDEADEPQILEAVARAPTPGVRARETWRDSELPAPRRLVRLCRHSRIAETDRPPRSSRNFLWVFRDIEAGWLVPTSSLDEQSGGAFAFRGSTCFSGIRGLGEAWVFPLSYKM